MDTLKTALGGDEKLAKSISTACKSHGKKAKRPADDSSASPVKKQKLEPHKRDLDYSSMAPDELESSLELPAPEEDEATIRKTTIVTNRAPLFLAFAVELLKITMPEQPPSSRLSIAQAVVSLNSKSKAVSLGINKPSTSIEISEAQPKAKVMGRAVPVLKRGGYTWSGGLNKEVSGESVGGSKGPAEKKKWTVSQKLSSKGSTFLAHAIPITSATQRAGLMKELMSQKPELGTATHNAWAVRASYGSSPLAQEASFDDGESGCGKFLLQVMKDANVKNMVVVLTRWYGGVMLGPDRWRLMRECVEDAISAQQRCTSSLAGEALWALDTEDTHPVTSTVGMAIHRPEEARNYLLRSFPSPASEDDKKKTLTAVNEEKQENLGRLLGALKLLYESWSEVLGPVDMNRRAWSWYVALRPDVEPGPAGWGAKGEVNLGKILDLRRKA